MLTESLSRGGNERNNWSNGKPIFMDFWKTIKARGKGVHTQREFLETLVYNILIIPSSPCDAAI